MATIGQALTTPEASWKRYDDNNAALSYLGAWSVGSSTSYFNSSYHNSVTYGTSLKFRFTGTKIRLIGYMATDRTDRVQVVIDGTPVDSFSMQIETATFIALAYEKIGLSDGEHTIEFINQFTDSLKNSFVVDAIDIDSSGRILHLDEVTDIIKLTIGKRIRCHYTASASGSLGKTSRFGQESYVDGKNDFISPTNPPATPNGDFYCIYAGKDYLDRMMLIPDRNLQGSISWDTLNAGGIASGSGLPLDYKPILPAMISATSPTPYVVTMSLARTNAEAWRAFGDGGGVWQATTGDWAIVDIGTVLPRAVNKYTIKADSNAGSYPKGWKIEGYNNTTATWETLDTQSNMVFAVNEVKTFSLNNNNVHTKYRVTITQQNGTNYANIVNIQFYDTTLTNYEITMRLLTGGTSSTDKDSEWDTYIVNSTLNGTITTGDNNIWNWKGNHSWTSTVLGATTSSRTIRGNTAVDASSPAATSNISTTTGFRPVLLVKNLNLFKYLVNDGGTIKKYGLLNGTTNIALNKSVTGSGYYSASTLSTVTDGIKNGANYYVSATSGTTGNVISDFITTIDLGTIVNISDIKALMITDLNTQYNDSAEIWVSTDNVNFSKFGKVTQAANPTDVTSAVKENGITNVQARYIQVRNFLLNSSYTRGALKEVEVYDATNAWISLGTAPATEDMFTSNGMKDLSVMTDSVIRQLVSANPTLLAYASNPSTTGKILRQENVPPPQLVKSNSDINITNIQSIIKTILMSSEANAGVLRLLASTDSGVTWKAFNPTTSAWVTVDSTNLSDAKAKGMTKNTVNALAATDWATLLSGSKTLRFAYYLELSHVTDAARADSLTLQVQMKGSWGYDKSGNGLQL